MTDDATAARSNTLAALLDELHALGGAEEVSLDHLVEEVGRHSFVPVALVPLLILISPLSAVPGLSSLLGLTATLVLGQMLFGRRRLWLPGALRRRTISGDGLQRAARFLRPAADRVAPLFRPRLTLLTDPPLDRLPLALCTALCAVMPAMEFVPMSASILASASALFVVGLFMRDGLFVVLGFAVLGAGAALIAWMLGGLG